MVSSEYLPPSSAAIILYLGMQRYEKEAPYKREQLVKQVREDPDVLALSCWALACEQPPGKIPNPGGVRTPQQFVDTFRVAVRHPPAKGALEEWFGKMMLPIPSCFRQEEEPDDDSSPLYFACVGGRAPCTTRRKDVHT